MPLNIGVVILNWRGAGDTLECLESLIACDQSELLNIFVVDNASGDNSVERIEEWGNTSGIAFRSLRAENMQNRPTAKIEPVETEVPTCTLVRSDENLGFCEGNNLGTAIAFESGADYVLVLNNDTAADISLVSQMQSYLADDDGTTLYSPQIARADDPVKVWWFGGEITWTLRPYYLNKGTPIRNDIEEPVPTKWVSGCATLISRQLWERLGLFDPIYFIWAEEWDLSLRAKAAGVPMRILPKLLIYHKAGRSLGTISPMVFFYSTRNLMILRRRYLPRLKHWAVQMFFIPRMFARGLKLALQHRDWSYITAFFDVLLSSRTGGKWRRQ